MDIYIMNGRMDQYHTLGEPVSLTDNPGNIRKIGEIRFTRFTHSPSPKPAHLHQEERVFVC